MDDTYLRTREFDSFSRAIREDVKMVADSVTKVAVQLDTLINGRIEEARVMGEITESIRALNSRLDKHETDARDMWDEIGRIRKAREESAGDKLKWWWEAVIFIGAAIIGGIVSKKAW